MVVFILGKEIPVVLKQDQATHSMAGKPRIRTVLFSAINGTVKNENCKEIAKPRQLVYML